MIRQPFITPKSKEQARQQIGAAKQVVTGIKNYGKNVAGGARIVGGAVKRAIKWPIKQIEREFQGETKKNKKYKEDAERLNREYSGLQ